MRYSEAKMGRVFVIKLDHGEVIHETLERFAAEQGIRSAAVLAVGAADKGSRLVVGPQDGDKRPIVPLEHLLAEAHEVAGVGTIFPDETGKPTLHMHIAAGREGRASAGCVRRGVKTWLILELIVFEILGTGSVRRMDSETGFELLSPE